jgi:hypothetical protein
MSMSMIGVILSVAVFQAERRIWRGSTTPRSCARDPSLRLQSGSSRDDAADDEDGIETAHIGFPLITSPLR